MILRQDTLSVQDLVMTQDNFRGLLIQEKGVHPKRGEKKDMANTLTQTGGLEGWMCVF